MVAGGVHAVGKSQGPGESAPLGEVAPKTAGGDGASPSSSAPGRGSGRGRRWKTFTAADPAAHVHERLRGNWRPKRAADGERPGDARCETYRCTRWGNVARGRAGGGEWEKNSLARTAGRARAGEDGAAIATSIVNSRANPSHRCGRPGEGGVWGRERGGRRGCHRRTAEVRGSGAKRAVARARRRWRRRETLGQPDGVGRKKRAPNTSSLERPRFYTQDDL